jgi:chromosome segregation ATPase
MSEKTSGSFSIDTYLSKHEGLLLEHIRRMLQAETKITLLESALQDMHRRNEELIKQVETSKVALDQAINGLSAVTNEKIELENKIKELDQTIVSIRSNLNSAIIQKSEFESLRTKLASTEADYETLKVNYDIVLDNYNKLMESVQSQPAVTEKKKKTKSTESEWTDGQY